MKVRHSGCRAESWRGLATQALPLAALLLAPKCPLCVAVYLGFLAAFGVSALTVSKWASFLLLAAGALLMGKVLRARAHAGSVIPFWLGLTGFLAIVSGRFILESTLLIWLGLALFLFGILPIFGFRRVLPVRCPGETDPT